MMMTVRPSNAPPIWITSLTATCVWLCAAGLILSRALRGARSCIWLGYLISCYTSVGLYGALTWDLRSGSSIAACPHRPVTRWLRSNEKKMMQLLAWSSMCMAVTSEGYSLFLCKANFLLWTARGTGVFDGGIGPFLISIRA